MPFILSVTSTLAFTNTLAYNEIYTLHIRNAYTVQHCARHILPEQNTLAYFGRKSLMRLFPVAVSVGGEGDEGGHWAADGHLGPWL